MNPLNRLLLWMAVSTLLCGIAAGCGKQTSLPKVPSNTFATAKPELQQIWAAAMACSEKNDYLGATTNLMALQARPSALSAEQKQAVDDLWAAMGNRIFAAAEKGNPEAVKAMQAVRQARPR
jgi:hypothetical protein